MTWNDVIRMALRYCGQLRAGSDAGPDLMNDGLLQAQVICDTWANDRNMNPTLPDYVYPITGPGTAPIESGQVLGMGYSIGPTGADLTGPRPQVIVRCNLIQSSTNPASRIPIQMISAEQWSQIPVLQLNPITVSLVAYYENTFPNGILWLWPPLSGNSIEIFTWGFCTAPIQLDQDFIFQPGYLDAFAWTLAARMWTMCDKSIMVNKAPHAYLLGQAYKARQAIKKTNAPMPKLISDFRGERTSSGESDLTLLETGIPSA